MKKRILAMLLVLTMIASYLPTGVMAEGGEGGNGGNQGTPSGEGQESGVVTTYDPLDTHDAEKHICEHCAAIWNAKSEEEKQADPTPDLTPEWTAWDGTTALEDGKHYVLSVDTFTPAATIALSSGSYVLCLNGKTIDGSQAGTIFALSGTASLTIVDCTAKTVTEGEGEAAAEVYKAGTLTGATASAVTVAGTAVFNMYDGVLTGNVTTGNGGAINVAAGASITIHGGAFIDNAAVRGGAIYSVSGNLNIANSTFHRNKVTGNNNRGGAISLMTTANASVKNCVFTHNTAASGNGGAVYTDDSSAVLDGCTFKNNSCGAGGSAVHVAGGDSHVTLKDCLVTENNNTATGNHVGAVYVTNATDKLTISGATQIYGNTTKERGEVNVACQNNGTYVYVDGLTKGARFSIFTRQSAYNDPDSYIKVEAGSKVDYWNYANITYKNKSTDTVPYYIHCDNATNTFSGITDTTNLHAHCGFGCTEADCGHYVAIFEEYTTANDLPASGSYYLNTANKTVTLSGAKTVNNLNLCLNGHTVQQTSGRVMTTSGGKTLSIYDCHVAYENDTYVGGVIRGGRNNTGAGIYVSAGSVFNLYGGRFTDNKPVATAAESSGSAIFLHSGSNPGATFNMYGGEITENGSAYSWGGAVGNGSGNVNNKVTFNMYGGTIFENDAMSGGAVYLRRNAAFNMYGGTIRNNHALGYTKNSALTGGSGGAIYAYGNDFRVAITIENGVIQENTAVANGGGLCLSKSDLTMTDGTISGNEAERGAGVYAESASVVQLSDGVITGNIATGDGGGVFLNNTNTELTMSGGEISGNEATNGAGVLVQSTAQVTMSGGEIKNNTATGDGGGMYISTNSKLFLSDGEIKDNTAKKGGGVYMARAASNTNNNTYITMTGGTISGNKAVATVSTNATTGVQTVTGGYGSGVCVSNAIFNLQGGVISGNGAKAVADGEEEITGGSGGGIALMAGGTMTMTGGEIVNNHVKSLKYISKVEGEKQTTSTRGGNGGGVYAEAGSTITMSDGIIGENSSDVTGGGVFLTSTDTTMTMTGGKLYKNSSANGGGVITQTKSAFTLDGGTMEQNSATSNGGGIYVSTNTDMVMTGGTISYNIARDGAGIYALRSNVTASGGEISKNEASRDGGAIGMSGAQVTLVGVEIQDNYAVRNGGAIITTVNTNDTSDTKDDDIFSELTVEDSQIKGNTAGGEAGAIYANNATKTELVNVEITGNEAKNGSAVAAYGGSITMDETIIEGNHATNSYGAVNLNASGSYGAIKVTVSGETKIINNTAGDEAVPQNMFMRNSATYLEANGLSGEAMIGVTMERGRLESLLTNITTGRGETELLGFFKSDSDLYQVAQKEEVYLKDHHDHCICGVENCTKHEQVEFLPWTSTTSLPTKGNWYLTADVQLTGTASVSGDLNLCLRGFDIRQTSGRVISVFKGKTLTITDHGEEPGVITGGKNDYGSAVYLNEGAVFNLYAGKLTGNVPASDAKETSGAAIFLRSADGAGATFNMYGGEISGNGNAYSWGGAVSNGVGNAKNTVYVNIYGGTISGNVALNGGAIRLENKAELTVSGGIISGNTANGNGGAVYLNNGAAMQMTGGEISGNTAKNAGGVLTQNKASFTMTGGKITANTASSNGGGVYASNGTTPKLSGDITISGNTVKDKANNLYLATTVVMELGELGKDAKVGISAAKPFRAISNKIAADYTTQVTSDSASYSVILQSGTLYLGAAAGHEHCICNSTASGCDHSKVVWAAWESTSTLPTTAGNYYLTADVQLTKAAEIGEDVNLCLNGHIVTAAKNARHLIVQNGAEVSITDCTTKPGGFTGGSRTYGGSVNVTAGTTLNLYGGRFYGNTAPESEGGAIYVQAGKTADGVTTDGGIVNMYGGEITGNSANTGAGIRLAGATSDTAKPSVLNLYGGTISENKAICKITKDEKTGKETKSGGYGGGIAATAGTVLNLQGGTISGNTAAKDGAGIYLNAKSQLTIKDAKLTNNVAEQYGGAVFATSNGTVVTMESGEMSGNQSLAGGAVMLQTRAVFNLNGGKISGNTGGKSGGGGLYISINTDFVMNGGEISGNTTTANGGGIYALRSRVTLNGGEISGNVAKNRAGAIAGSGAEVVFNKITVKGNSAKEGGAAYFNRTSATSTAGEVTYYPSTVTINEGALITENKAETNCGGILTANEGTVMTMVGGEISKNTAVNGGGVMTWSKSLFVLKGGKITGNTATSGGGGLYISTDTTFQMEGGEVSKNVAKSGGGIFFLRSEGTLSGGKVTGNRAKATVTINATTGAETKSGGQGGGLYLSGATVYLKGTSLTYNVADTNGGAVITGRTSATVNGVKTYFAPKLVMTSGVISGNTAVNAAGVLTQTDTVFELRGGTITGNTASNSGGGVYVSTKSTFHMTGGSVTGNHAEKYGGGIYCLKSTANITGGELNSNTAVTNSGNLMVNGETAVVTVKNMDIYGGEANTAGAMVVQSKGTLNVENCQIHDNKSLTGHGGAIFISNKSFGNFTNTKFYNNVSAKLGGAVLVNNYANGSFVGCEFVDNKATTDGGAIWASVASNTTIDSCSFTKNVAEQDAGAIHCRGNMTIKDSLFEGNTAARNGGAVSTSPNAVTGSGIMLGLAIENTQIKNNTAGGQGGGIHGGMGCTVKLFNTEITGNKATMEGGGVWSGENLELHGVTVTGNTSGGAGYALYMGPANYDSHSYWTSRNKMSGNVIVKDNTGGDMYLDAETVIAITAEGMGKDTLIHLTLDSGILTSRILGAYNYEGGNQVYTLTAGDRSITDPEIPAPVEETVEPTEGTEGTQATEPANENTLLYAGVGAFAVVIAAIAVIVILLGRKKKKAEESATEVTQD